MERLVNYLQQVALSNELAQFYQWLCTYLLYTQTAIMPTVEVRPHTPGLPLVTGVRWRCQHLLLPDRALQQIPARPLALLAINRHFERLVYRQMLLQNVWITALLLFAVGPLLHIIGEHLPESVFRWIFGIVVALPLHYIWARMGLVGERADKELLQRIGEVEAFLQGMEAAIRTDIISGVSRRQVELFLQRLNAVREQYGYPPLIWDDLQPPPPHDSDGQEAMLTVVIDKDDFLRKHPPDEYDKVDSIKI